MLGQEHRIIAKCMYSQCYYVLPVLLLMPVNSAPPPKYFCDNALVVDKKLALKNVLPSISKAAG